MSWAAIVFGWPAAITSILCGLLGVASGRWKWVAAGLLLGGPFLLFLALTPRFGWIALVVAAGYAGAAVAARRERTRLAWALFTPMLALVVYVGWVVLDQPGPGAPTVSADRSR
jgi:hypothetical protein